jgi:hypothetical protein
MITSAATALAAVRALGALPAAQLDAATLASARAAAAVTGRTLERVTADGGPALALAWAATSVPTMEDHEHGEYRWLRPAALRSWAFCLGLAWRDRSAHPWPGEPFSVADLVDAAAMRGSNPLWIRSALMNTLLPAGLVEIDKSTVRLGAAAAVLPDAYVDALRRVHDRLPRKENAPAGDHALGALAAASSEEEM